MFRPHWVCPAQGCLCFPRLHCSGSRLLYMERALPWVRFQFSCPPQKRGFGFACMLCLQAARGLGALSPGAARLFPPRPQRAPPVGSQEVFRQEPGACSQCGRGWLLWGWVCTFPLPPASYLQRGWQALLCSFSVPLFCEPPTVCSGWLIFPRSPTV